MKVQYRDEEESVESFTADELLYRESDHYGGARERIRLESQPYVLAAAIGRILDMLLTKGLMTEAEFHAILETDGDRRQAKVVPE